MQNEAKNSTKRAKQKNRRNKNQKQTKQQPKRQTKNLHSDIGPHTVPKDNDLLIFRIGMAIFFLSGALCLSAGRGALTLLVYHVRIAAPYLGGIDPRLAVYARS
jgi:hypothetical protein